MVIITLNQSVMNLVRMILLILNHLSPPEIFHPQSLPVTSAILLNLLHLLEPLHIAVPSLAAPSSHPLLPRLGLIISTTTQPHGGDPYPTLDLRQISEMAVSDNASSIQRTGNIGPIPILLPVLTLCNAPPPSPILRGPLIRDLLMQIETSEMILGTGVLNGTTDVTTASTAESTTGRGLLTTDVICLISVTRTTVASTKTRVPPVLCLLSTNKVTTILPGTMMKGLRTANNHPPKMLMMTDGCRHRPPPQL
jgi:hypothetical protein